MASLVPAKIAAVAWREFRYTALTKAFIFGAVLLPLIMWIAFPLIAMLTDREEVPFAGTLAVVDTTGELTGAIEIEFDEEKRAAERAAATQALIEKSGDALQDGMSGVMEVAQEASTLADPTIDITIQRFANPEDLEAVKGRVREGEFVAVVTADDALLEVPSAPEPGATPAEVPDIDLFVPSEIKTDHTRILRREIADAVVRARAARAGQDIEALERLTRRPRFNAVALTEGGNETQDSSELKEILPFAFMILLWVSAFTSGNYLLTTTIEEKSNKVMEVLLSAVSPMTLMTGKIIGQGLVGMVMLLMYGTLGIAALVFFATLDLIPMWQIGMFLIYFVMAFFFIASLFAAVGSAVSDLHEAQTLLTPVMLIIFAPMVLMIPASQDPNGMLATVTSFIPPLTPFLMVVRMVAGDVPAWQFVATIVVGSIGVVVGLWACAKIFRVGVLMQGKPPTPLQLIKWLRYA